MTDIPPVRHYGGKPFDHVYSGGMTKADSVIVIIHGRGGLARRVKDRGGADLFHVFANDKGRMRARETIEKFKAQLAVPKAD